MASAETKIYVEQVRVFIRNFKEFIDQRLIHDKSKKQSAELIGISAELVSQNLRRKLLKLDEICSRLPKSVEIWGVSNIWSGNSQKVRLTDRDIEILNIAKRQATRYMTLAKEALDEFLKIAKSRQYVVQKQEGHLAALTSLEVSAEFLLQTGASLAGHEKPTGSPRKNEPTKEADLPKTWIPKSLRLENVLLRVKYTCEGLFKKSATKHDDAKAQISKEAKQDLVAIADESRHLLALNARLSATTTRMLQGRTDYTQQPSAQMVISFARYMERRNPNDINKEDVLNNIKTPRRTC